MYSWCDIKTVRSLGIRTLASTNNWTQGKVKISIIINDNFRSSFTSKHIFELVTLLLLICVIGSFQGWPEFLTVCRVTISGFWTFDFKLATGIVFGTLSAPENIQFNKTVIWQSIFDKESIIISLSKHFVKNNNGDQLTGDLVSARVRHSPFLDDPEFFLSSLTAANCFTSAASGSSNAEYTLSTFGKA